MKAVLVLFTLSSVALAAPVAQNGMKPSYALQSFIP